jgi:Bacterial Ig-like domain (group 2)
MHRVPASIASSCSDCFRRVAVFVVIPLVALIVTACGGDSSPSAPSPTTAAPAAPTVSALRIEGPDALRTGVSVGYTATATLSNGTTQTVTPTWSSSSSSIAAVDSSGRVTGQSHGQATLTATHQGVSTAKAVSVVANFGGQWSGVYVMKACDQSGVFATIEYCQGLGPVGSAGPIALSLTQGGNDQSQLSGAISFGGSVTGSVTGNVTADARMVIGATFNIVGSGVTFTLRVGGWESRLSGPSSMTGRWADNLTAVGVTGNAYTENELQAMVRSSLAQVPSSAPHVIRLEWTEMFASMRGRR